MIDADGRWPDILTALGIDRKFLTIKNGPCPMCGGKDRWRFDDKDGRGTYFCSHCGAGDGFGLVKAFCRVDFMGAKKLIEGVIGSARIEPRKDRICEDEARERANRMWSGTVLMGEPLRNYLRRRRVDQLWSDVRFHPALPYERASEMHPAMVAMVRDAAGRPATLHRTYLDQTSGDKADVLVQRKTSHGLSLPKGAAVRLCPAGPKLGIGEGLETCMAASIKFNVPVWSALNADNMAAWWPPEGVKHVVIFGDSDANYVGQCAAYTLAKRLSLPSRGSRYVVTMAIPPRIGEDWADVLMREGV